MDEVSILEERIQDKIEETKIKMDKTTLRSEAERLWPIIETLKWVLNGILEVRSEPLRAQLWNNEYSLS
jgi:hypothetical protein